MHILLLIGILLILWSYLASLWVLAKICKRIQSEKNCVVTSIRSEHSKNFEDHLFFFYYDTHGI